MNKCYHCGKGILFGRSHTHHRGVAGGRWKKRAPKTRRIFRPNLKRTAIIVSGKTKTVKLCMKCLKRIKKDLSEGKKPFLQLVNVEKKLKSSASAKASHSAEASGDKSADEQKSPLRQGAGKQGKGKSASKKSKTS